MNARLAVLVAVTVLSCTKRAPESDYGDIQVKVYVAPSIRTNDPSRPIVQAMAVKDGDVVAIGSRDEVMASESVKLSSSEVIELNGVVVPGIVDSHAHLSSLGRSLSVVSLRGAKSAAEAVEKMKTAPKESYQGDWLLGRGW